MSNFLESHHIPNVITSARQPKGEDMYEGNIVSDVWSMSNWNWAIVIVKKLAGATGTATFTCEACDNVTPDTHPNIGGYYYRTQTTPDTVSAWTYVTATTGTAITAGADAIWEFAIPASALQGGSNRYGYEFCRVTLTETESTAVDGSVDVILVEPRVAQSIPASVLS